MSTLDPETRTSLQDPPVTESVTSSAPPGASGNIEQIRDIIFGTQMRDYERRFAQLEERLLKDSTDLRQEISRRLTALDESMRRELAELGDRLVTEQRARSQDVDQLNSVVDVARREAARRINDLAEETTKAQKEMQTELAQQSSALGEEIRQRWSDVSATLKREADELHFRKADRTVLGGLFAELAAQLADEERRSDAR